MGNFLRCCLGNSFNAYSRVSKKLSIDIEQSSQHIALAWLSNQHSYSSVAKWPRESTFEYIDNCLICRLYCPICNWVYGLAHNPLHGPVYRVQIVCIASYLFAKLLIRNYLHVKCLIGSCINKMTRLNQHTLLCVQTFYFQF